MKQIFCLLYVVCLMGTSLVAQSQYTSIPDVNLKIPDYLKPKVTFWYNIFTSYPQNTYLIHDKTYPEVVIDFLDFNHIEKKFNKGQQIPDEKRIKIINQMVEAYQKEVDKMASKKAYRVTNSAGTKLVKLVKRNTKFRNLLKSKKVKLRYQKGMADEFKKAATRAYTYLPYMEQIFEEEGIPIELTRIAFIESMFKYDAISKVGASGIWQIMPRTAREFLHVNKKIDERNSPNKATIAAAKTLRNNYKLLKSWPLAITAYNHGPYGIKRGVEKIGSRNLGELIKKYNAKTFGFASKNFYAEFLAASYAYKNLYKRKSKPKNPMNIEFVQLKNQISLKKLTSNTPLTLNIIKRYNQCLSTKGYAYYKDKPLPKGFTMVIPQNHYYNSKKYLKRKY